ncbi:lasso peptide biosynthesis PqqD family chaperone [Saccharopolyspora sp. NPDC050642]|uniref:lasso peptide biosynthesis PqqD family chaperone n=1 Tax=Saccharopolyspora sp. NPDC050642 TaxID=3157099 RepID=UPI0033F8859D
MLLRLHPEVTSTDTDDGTVLLHGRTGRYFQLNPTGTRVLQRLLGGSPPDHIAAELAEHHHIAPERAARDVTAVVDQLRTAELVITS